MNLFSLFRCRSVGAVFLGGLSVFGGLPVATGQTLLDALNAARNAQSAGGQNMPPPLSAKVATPAREVVPAPVQPAAVPTVVKLPENPAPAGLEKSAYAEIYRKNVFDPARQPWGQKVAAPQEVLVTPITSSDAEVYGVMMFGDYKKAVIKLGQGFKFAPQPKNKGVPRPFVTLGVGESLGPYMLTEINEKNIVFANGGAQFSLAFTHKKVDRPPAAAISPMAQEPVVLAAPTPTIVPGIEPIVEMPPATAAPPVPVQPASFAPAPAAAPAAASPPTAASPTGDAAPAPSPAAPGVAPAAGAPAQGMSLLEAIQAAQRAGAAK